MRARKRARERENEEKEGGGEQDDRHISSDICACGKMCMHAYTCVDTQDGVFMCTFVQTHLHACIALTKSCMHVHTSTNTLHACIYMCIQVKICKGVCMNIHVQTHGARMYVYMNIHTTHTHICVHIHTT